MTTVRFGGTATNFMLYQMAKDKQEQEKLQKLNNQRAQMTNQSQYGCVPNNFYQQQFLPSQPQSQVRFSGDPIVSWALGKGAETVTDNFLKAGPKKYEKVHKHDRCPLPMLDGHRNLESAGTANSPATYLASAEQQFVSAANATEVHTTKAHAYRRAAIAAKLRGEDEVAKGYMKLSKEHELKAAGKTSDPGPCQLWAVPSHDLKKLNEECFDTSTSITNEMKQDYLDFCGAIDKFFTGKSDAQINKHKAEMMDTLAPYNKAIKDARKTLQEKFDELEGHASDNEWVNGRDRKSRGASTGKGIRHQYPVVEKHRLHGLP